MKIIFSLPLKLLGENTQLFLGLGNGVGYSSLNFSWWVPVITASPCHYCQSLSLLLVTVITAVAFHGWQDRGWHLTSPLSVLRPGDFSRHSGV